MKHIATLILCFMLLDTLSAQSYFTGNETWYTQEECMFSQNCITKYEKKVWILGDTVFAGEEYKIFKEVYTYLDSPLGPFPEDCDDTGEGTFQYYLRQEEKQIWEYAPNMTSPKRLLFDYSLELGDTAYFFLHDPKPVVEKIDSVFITGKMRKRITFNFSSAFSDNEHIEGLGGAKGLFWKTYGGSVDCLFSSLCFEENERLEQVYGSGCSRLNVGQLPMVDEIFFSMNKGELQVNSSRHPITQVVVYDLLGRILYVDKPNSKEVSLELSGKGNTMKIVNVFTHSTKKTFKIFN